MFIYYKFRDVILSAVMILCIIGAVNAATTTMVFQNGLNGYAGTRDAQLRINSDNSYGGSPLPLRVADAPYAWSSGFPDPVLLAFDNIFGTGANQFNPAAVITSAKLKLYVTYNYNPGGNSYLQAYRMLTPWVEGTSATWGLNEGASTGMHRYYRSSGSYTVADCWGTTIASQQGPVGGGVDYSVNRDGLAYFSTAPVGTWIEIDITGLVNAWRTGAVANNGIYMFTSGTYPDLRFNSSEYATDPSLRPKLEITTLSMDVPPGTAIFKQGYNSYNGCRDTMLMGEHSIYNYGGADPLILGGPSWATNPAAARPSLIGFDGIFGLNSGQVPTDSVITNAKLRLYVTSKQIATGGWNLLGLYPMQTPWVAGTLSGADQVGSSCFEARKYQSSPANYAADPNNTWGYTGAVAAGPNKPIDYDMGPTAIKVTQGFTSLTTPGWIEIDVKSFVNAWKDGIIPNNGIYGFTTDYWSYMYFRSSESTDPNLRPELVIEYRPLACGDLGVPYPEVDISGPSGVPDCYVDIYDAKAFAQTWVGCTTPGGSGCTQLEPIGIIPAGTATVDGDLGDWANAGWINLDQLYYGTASDIAEAKMALRWDAVTDTVYAAVKVRDTQHVLDDVPFAWDSDDHIEIYTQGDKTVGDTYNNTTCELAQQYLVGIGLSAGSEWAFLGSNYESADAAGLQYACSVSGDWLNYEVGVPQYSLYGAIGGGSTTVKALNVDDVIRFDILAFSRYTTPSSGSEMKAENTMSGKYQYASAFREYKLVSSGCGEWGHLAGDYDQNCKVDMKDFAKMAIDWLYCTDPQNVAGCDQTWRQ